jgi:hypothetical protein
MSSNLTAPLVPVGGAFIDDLGFVRITEELDARPRLLMESHWTTRCFHARVGCGPAIFVQAAGGLTEDLFNAAGGGLVIELGSGPTSWNLIVGALLDFSVERLRPEYIHGFPSPTPELIYLTKKEVNYFIGVAMSLPNF